MHTGVFQCISVLFFSPKVKKNTNKIPQIRTLKDLDNSKKLGDTSANYYPSSQTELEEQLSCAKKDREVAIYWGSMS